VRALQVAVAGEPTAVLHLEDIPAPEPGPGQVTIRVGAAAIGLPDVLLCRGTYQLHPPWPFTPGLEAAGTVQRVGMGGDPDLVGQRVVGVPALPHGALAEEAVLAAAGIAVVPDAVRDVDAAATHISHTTAHVALHRRARLEAGQTLLVHAAAGATGAAAVQLGVRAGARVLATAGSAARVDVCRELGAEVAINYRDEDFVDVVRTVTDGRGVDVVFDPVGGEVFRASQRCVASEGMILVVGFAGGEVQDIAANRLLYRNFAAVGLYMGAYSRDDAGRRVVLDAHRAVMALLGGGHLRPLASAPIALEDVAAALEALARREIIGRTVVCP
jgi:NADPH2:quinone reductase